MPVITLRTRINADIHTVFDLARKLMSIAAQCRIRKK